jgi:hypothetical protein
MRPMVSFVDASNRSMTFLSTQCLYLRSVLIVMDGSDLWYLDGDEILHSYTQPHVEQMSRFHELQKFSVLYSGSIRWMPGTGRTTYDHLPLYTSLPDSVMQRLDWSEHAVRSCHKA